MKTYLARFSILEGEHEYRSAFLLSAESTEQAFDIARSQEHEPTILDDTQEPTCWDYGDGATASRLAGVVEITEEEAATLERLGIAFYFNQEPSAQQKQAESKKLFCVWAIGKEYFPSLDIEANTKAQAEEEYRQAWENGRVLSHKYEFTVTSTDILE